MISQSCFSFPSQQARNAEQKRKWTLELKGLIVDSLTAQVPKEVKLLESLYLVFSYPWTSYFSKLMSYFVKCWYTNSVIWTLENEFYWFVICVGHISSSHLSLYLSLHFFSLECFIVLIIVLNLTGILRNLGQNSWKPPTLRCILNIVLNKSVAIRSLFFLISSSCKKNKQTIKPWSKL